MAFMANSHATRWVKPEMSPARNFAQTSAVLTTAATCWACSSKTCSRFIMTLWKRFVKLANPPWANCKTSRGGA
eukprot:8229906-Lingulodinium_polyedra.AAC.1